LSKKFVEYDVVVKDGHGGFSTLRNLTLAASLGGTNDYEEVVLEATEFAFSGKLDASNIFKNKNGTIVIVAFVDGSKDKPFILTAIQHPKRDGAKKADGIRLKGEFRGVQWEIDKDGQLILTQQSPRSPDGKLKNKDKVLSVVKFDKDGNFILNDKEKNTIKLDNTGKKIIISQEQDGTVKNKLEMDRNAPKILMQSGDGTKMTIDAAADKVVMETTGGTKVTIDGSNKITLEAGATKIEIDGASGKIKLDGNLVDVGTGASALAALGPQLISWLTSHTHMGDGGPVPAPTSPPLVPPPVSLLSTTVKIKS
jgi:phage baseplate assembly protein gpV